MRFRGWLWIAAGACGLHVADGAAQCVAKPGSMDYRIVQGDTLYSIARRYLIRPGDWRTLQRLNRVGDPRRLVPGAGLRLPFTQLNGVGVSAQVIHAVGATTMLSLGAAAAQPLKVGARVHGGGLIKVADRSYLSLQLPDHSVVHIEANSEVRVQSLCRILDGAVEVVDFRLEKGRIESAVTPRQPQSRFEVTTPLAVASVRGTQFGVEVAASESTGVDVTDGHVRVSPTSAGHASLALPQGQGVKLSPGGGLPMLTQLLAAPDLSRVMPSQLSTTLDLPVQPLTGAVRYRFKIASDASFDHVILAASEDRLPIRIAGLGTGSYYVAVRAEDASGLPGLPSVRHVQLRTRPEPPLLSKPAQEAVVQGPSVAFACTQNMPAMGYYMQISQESEFIAPRSFPLQANCAFQVDGFAPGAYYWRAAAAESSNAGADAERGPWSHPVRFVVVPPVRQPGIGAHRFDGNTVHIDLGTLAGGKYLLQVAEDAQFQNIVKEYEETANATNLQLERGKVYYLRSQLISIYGLRSAYSITRKIAVPAVLKDALDRQVVDAQGNPIGLPE